MIISEHLNCSLDHSKLAIGVAIGVGAITAIGLAYLYKKKLDNSPPKKYVKILLILMSRLYLTIFSTDGEELGRFRSLFVIQSNPVEQ